MNNDLISRSALLADMQEYLNQEVTNDLRFTDMGEGIDLAMERVKEAPTVDAEVVRHGQNVTATHPSDMFVCSECGFSCEITEIRYEDGMGEPDAYEYDCKYCPNCGAKMDAEVQDDA